MISKKINNISFLQFSQLLEFPNFLHAIFLRNNGISQGPYKGLNLAYKIGDEQENVTKNLNLIQEVIKEISLSTPLKSHSTLKPQLHWAEQTHSANCTQVKAKDNNPNSLPQEFPNCDALLTDQPNKALMIKHADCQASIIYDPMNHAFTNIHSGWKGSIQNIYKEAILYMKKWYGSKPENLLACIGPSLSPQASEFKNYKKELPEEFWSYQIYPYYFDFWQISQDQLKECGILPHHIEIANICTFSNPNHYFSYRRNNTTGRHGTVAMLT